MPRMSTEPINCSRPRIEAQLDAFYNDKPDNAPSAVSLLTAIVARLFMFVLAVFFLVHLLTTLLRLTRPPKLCAPGLSVHIRAHREA